ncbi:DUF58 domain-containing protein [Mycolicibacterium sp. XJ1819]
MHGSTTADDGDGPHPLALLASALAGRTVAVRPTAPGEPAWTDGTSIYLDTCADARDQLEALTVQASLLAGGSLEPDLVRQLLRRPALARRYLSIEGQRALTANDDLLPTHTRVLVDCDLVAQPKSPTESLTLAARRNSAADPPKSFGVIKARHLLSARAAAARADAQSAHAPRRESRKELEELDEDAAAEEELADPFSSPVGGGGFVGQLLARMMNRIRQLNGGGTPGADTPTHKTRKGSRAAGAVTSVASGLSGTEFADDTKGEGRKYPEWDVHRRRYRPDWCTVHEIEPPLNNEKPLARPDVHSLRRPLTRLGIGLDRAHRQTQGDDLDIDAAVEARVELLAGSAPDEAVYLDSLPRRRDLAVLVLLDVSGSAGEAGTVEGNVHEQQRTAAAALTIALHELGDRVALYAYQSQGRAAVNLLPLKRFDDSLDTLVMRRLAALTPGAYSRLGAAIRHGTSVIAEKAGTSRRLLLVVSDGLAYDHDYERAYGAADARRALAEARRQGIGCLCLTIGAATDTGELRKVFGSAAHASIPKPARLGDVIGPLFRAALRTADLRRRVS